MDFNNFTTLSYILSFPGMIAIVIMLTQFTKSIFDGVFENRTKYIVYGWSLFFCILAAVILGNWENMKSILDTLVVWMCNSVIVWFAAMKAFEVISKKEGGTNGQD